MKAYYIFLIAWLLACNKDNTLYVARPPVASAIDSVWRAINTDQFSNATLHYMDSILSRQGELKDIEKLFRLEVRHWYHTTFKNGDYAAASLVADTAIVLFANAGLKKEKPLTYANFMLFKGDALVHLKEFSDAFNYYFEVKTEFEHQWDACQISRFTSRLGLVRYKQRDYHDAIRYYQEAYSQFEQCGKAHESDDFYQAVTEPQALLNGIAWFYELLEQHEEAATYYQRALDFIERESVRYPDKEKAAMTAKAVIYGNLGGMLSKLGHHEDAVRHLQASIAINSQPGYDHRDLQTAQVKLAEAYINLGRYEDARIQLENCRLGLDSLPNPDQEIKLSRVDWMLQERIGDLRQAHTALLRYRFLQDSADRKDKFNFNADFRREFERKEQQIAYAALAHKHELNRLAFLVSLLALLLVLAIVFLLYKHWKRSKQHNQHLNKLNERIHLRNEKLQLALNALQDSQQENKRILAMVAHDLRNPLTTINMALYELKDGLSIDKQNDDARFLEIIERSNTEALLLINELLHSHSTHITADASDEIDLDMMIRDCLDTMKFRADKKRQRLVYEGEPLSIRGSREKIWRVISNLIENSIKFSHPGSDIDVRLWRDVSDIVIEVIDRGIGIDPGMKDKVFEMVPGQTGTTGEPSTGLGLAIVKQIVYAHKGNIHFTSQPNGGTTFYVRFPS